MSGISYSSKTIPMTHQAAEEGWWDAIARGIFWDMGTGKTKLAIDNIGYLFQSGKINGAIIFAPKGMYHQWVQDEDHSEWALHSGVDPDDVAVYQWTNSASKANLEARENVLHAEDGYLDVVVINTEAVIGEKCRAFLKAFLAQHDVITVMDEASMIKNHKAKRSKVIQAVGKRSKYRRALTGTPVTNSPLDMFGIFMFLDEEVLGRLYTVFRARYAVMGVGYGPGGREFKKVEGFQNLGELREKIQPHSSRVLKRDVLDLPPLTYKTIRCPLGKKQAVLYNQMLKDSLIEIEHEIDGGTYITPVVAQSVLAKLTRLKQICCGFIPDPETGVMHPIPDHTRYTALMEFLELSDGKVIIWCDFTQNVADIAKLLKKVYGAYSYVTYTGKTKNREEAQNRFRTTEECRFFLATTQTGQLGLNLIEACTMVFFSRSYNLGNGLQATDRFYRKGQEKPVTVWDIVAPGTIDLKIRDRLIEKKKMSDMISDGEIMDWLREVRDGKASA